jgi:hypothetical protein
MKNFTEIITTMIKSETKTTIELSAKELLILREAIVSYNRSNEKIFDTDSVFNKINTSFIECTKKEFNL